MLDAVHMLKLVRNCFASDGQILHRGLPIHWKFIDNLHKIQENENFRLGNKLSKAHVEWDKKKMKVILAAQTLSESVADAIEFIEFRQRFKLKQF